MTNSAAKWTAEKPLLGAQFCCTSIAPEVRTELAEWLHDMGADHTLDLTSDVTHLLVGDTDSQKYQYVAREREDVKVLLPDFVGAIRNLWMNDHPIDFRALEAKYRCPTLYGLKISITGFEDLAFRNELAQNITENGGGYSGDLTKDLTHLIANAPVGKKYEYATAWGLRIVSLKWYKDTLDRGMQLDESKYHPTLPPQQQGLGAWIRQPSDSPHLGKRRRQDQPEEKTTRKIRRTASARFGSQQNEMWNDIVGQRGSEHAENTTSRLIYSRSMSGLNDEYQSHRQDSYLRDNLPQAHKAPQPGPQQTSTGILTNKNFATRGFDTKKKSVLYQHLTGHGAAVYETLSELKEIAQVNPDSCFVIVPHDIEGSQLNILEQSCANVNIVTELWLEYCISTKLFVPSDRYLLGQPVAVINLPAMTKLVVNASGFPQIQTLHISKVVNKLGARYEEKFTPETSVLICNSSSLNFQKIEHAQAWQVPVVSENWLWQLIRGKRLPSYEPFRIVGQNDRRADRDSQSQRQSIHNQTEQTPRSSSNSSTRQVSESEQYDSFIAAANAREPASNLASTDLSMIRAKTRTKTTEGVRGHEAEASEPERNVSHAESQKYRAPIPTPMPLQEISPNIRSKRASPAKTKRKLFQQYDGANSYPIEPTTEVSSFAENVLDQTVTEDDTEQQEQLDEILELGISNANNPHSKLVSEFLAIKAAAESRVAAAAAKSANSKPPNKKLLGRALSNLSNSSNKSKADGGAADLARPPLSRASSINSVNTDGLGVPLSMMSRIPSDLKRRDSDAFNVAPTDAGPRNTNRPETPQSPSDLDFRAALTSLSTSQLPHPPSPSQPAQLTYADSEEAVALKAHLAEKRRNRAKLGQKDGDPEPKLSREESDEQRQRAWRERQKDMEDGLRDDEAVVGIGRRTRGREKALRMALGDPEGELLYEGDIFH